MRDACRVHDHRVGPRERGRLSSSLSRRGFVAGLAGFGAALVLPSCTREQAPGTAQRTGLGRGAAATPANPRRIDVHCHFVPPAYRAYYEEQRPSMSPFTAEPPQWDVSTMLADFDSAGVATGILSLPQPGIWWGGRDRIRRIAREVNEYNAKLMSDHPGRFGMFATLPPPSDIEGCLRETEYALETLKADGIYLKTNYYDVADGTYSNDRWLGDPAFAPLYQELNRRNTVIYTHPQEAACCLSLAAPVPRTAVEYQSNTSRTIGHLLQTGTATRYPNIRWVFSHAGGTVPFLIERFVGSAVAPYLRDGGALAEGAPAPRTTEQMPKGALYELQRFYYDTAQSTSPGTMLALRHVVPVSQIVFGTDYPYVKSSLVTKGLEISSVFNAQELQAINRDNVVRILTKYA